MSRVYTDLAVLEVGMKGARAVELVDGLSIEELRRLTGVTIAWDAVANDRGSP